MKIDFSTVVYDRSGAPAASGLNPDEVLTLAEVAGTALLGLYPDERSLDGKDKFIRYSLWKKISDGGSVDLTVEDIALIKKLVGKAFGPITVGQAWAMLDQ